MTIQLLKEMFDKMVIEKNTSLIPEYYHSDFLLFTNGIQMDYTAFLKSHEEIYASPIQYQIEYDEETLLEKGNKISARLWITISKPHQNPTKIEVILIAEYKEGKIYRLWELTYPDWSQLPDFEDKI